MSMFEQFKSDEKAEAEGIYIDYGDFRVRIARAGGANKAYRKALDKATRPHRRSIATDNFEEKRAKPLLMGVFAQTVVLDWDVNKNAGQDDVDPEWVNGIEGEDGELLEMSKANILATFKKLPDLYDDLSDQANKSSLFRASLREEASEN